MERVMRGSPFTTLGKALRQVRLDRGMRLAEMADAYGCTSSFLSQIELGRKSPPAGFFERLSRNCSFSPSERAFVEQAYEALIIDVAVSPETSSQAEVAKAFARGLRYLEEEDLAKIRTLLESAAAKLQADRRSSRDATEGGEDAAA